MWTYFSTKAFVSQYLFSETKEQIHCCNKFSQWVPPGFRCCAVIISNLIETDWRGKKVFRSVYGRQFTLTWFTVKYVSRHVDHSMDLCLNFSWPLLTSNFFLISYNTTYSKRCTWFQSCEFHGKIGFQQQYIFKCLKRFDLNVDTGETSIRQTEITDTGLSYCNLFATDC